MKNSFLLSFFAAGLLFLISDVGNATIINWIQEDYTIIAESMYSDGGSETDHDSQLAYGPPLPISLATSVGGRSQQSTGNTAVSQTAPDSFEMYLNTYSQDAAHNASAQAGSFAIAQFYGTFVAQEPTFQFDYTLSYSIYAEGGQANSYAYNGCYFGLLVGTGGDRLYSGYSVDGDMIELYGVGTVPKSNSSSDIISVDIPVGQHIWVFVEAYEESGGWVDAIAGTTSVKLDYTMSTVPEPTTLLLLGLGAAMVGRRRK